MTRARQGKGAAGDCRAQLSELFGYLDGELTPARCRAVERHLASCHCCAHLAEGVRRAIAACQLAGQSRLPRGVQGKALARARALVKAAPIARARRP